MGAIMYNVAYITDDNYVLPTAASINSLIKNSGDAEFRIFLIAHKVRKERLSAIAARSSTRVDIRIIDSGLDFSTIDAIHPWVTKSSLCKFALPSILADLDSVLYIDGDTVLYPGFTGIFSEDISNRYAAVVMDLGAMRFQKAHVSLGLEKYFNSGVMYLNLAKMRKDGIPEKLMKYRIEHPGGVFMDQDAFNAVFHGNVTYASLKYNCLELYSLKFSENEVLTFFNATENDLRNPAVRHFAGGDKPWQSHRASSVDCFAQYVPREDILPVARNYISLLEEDVTKSLSIINSGTPKRPYTLGDNMLRQSADGVTLEGFSEEEAWGRWTTGSAKIQVSSEDFLNLSGDIRLHMRLYSWHEDRNVTITFNGLAIFNAVVPCGDKMTNVDMTLERAKVQGFNTIELIPSGEPCSPADLRLSADSRKIALGVAFVKIVENTAGRFSAIEEDGKALKGETLALADRMEHMSGDIGTVNDRLARLDVDMAALRNELLAIRTSISYKIGRAITCVPRKIRDKIRQWR